MTELTEKMLATERKYTWKTTSVDLRDIEQPDGRKARSAWFCWKLKGNVE